MKRVNRKYKKNKAIKKRDYIRPIIIFVLISILILIWGFRIFGNIDSSPEKDIEDKSNIENTDTQDSILKKSYVTIYFYDNKTSCPLKGNLSINDKIIGEAKEGKFNLSKEDYDNFKYSEIKIKGLTDSCFGRNENLPFVDYWILSNLENYFENEEQKEIILEINPRWPKYPEEMQGFIRPNEVEEQFLKIPIDEEDSDLKNLNKIFKYTYMNYVTDKGRFGEIEYWQTPKNFIENKGGDCEDWAIYTISLIRRYNSDLDCYAAVWRTHMNIICSIEGNFIILNQEKVKGSFKFDNELITQDNLINAHKWINNYFDRYGLPPEDRIISYLINEEEIIEFKNGREDFFAWVIDKGLSVYKK